MHIDRAIERRQAFPQDLLAKMLSGDDLAQVLRQQIEQGELGTGKLQRLAIKAGLLSWISAP